MDNHAIVSVSICQHSFYAETPLAALIFDSFGRLPSRELDWIRGSFGFLFEPYPQAPTPLDIPFDPEAREHIRSIVEAIPHLFFFLNGKDQSSHVTVACLLDSLKRKKRGGFAYDTKELRSIVNKLMDEAKRFGALKRVDLDCLDGQIKYASDSLMDFPCFPTK